jgi:putative addiction module killer protein
MIEVRRTAAFSEWLKALRDNVGKARIVTRIERMQAGNFGDAKFFDGIGEMRVNVGPGYRVYFAKRGDVLVILLCGGDKSSQARDIRTAIEMAKEI